MRKQMRNGTFSISHNSYILSFGFQRVLESVSETKRKCAPCTMQNSSLPSLPSVTTLLIQRGKTLKNKSLIVLVFPFCMCIWLLRNQNRYCFFAFESFSYIQNFPLHSFLLQVIIEHILCAKPRPNPSFPEGYTLTFRCFLIS